MWQNSAFIQILNIFVGALLFPVPVFQSVKVMQTWLSFTYVLNYCIIFYNHFQADNNIKQVP